MMEDEKVADEEVREQAQDDYGFEDITLDAPEIEEPEQEEQEQEVREESELEPELESELESELEQEPIEPEQELSDDDEPEPDLAAQNAALRDHIEKLSGQLINGGQVAKPADIQPTEQTKPVATPEQAIAEVMNFLEGTSVDDILDDPSKFNAVLNSVSKRSSEVASQQAVQQILRTVPELVMGYITRHSAMNRMVEDFYKENSDLGNVKQTVAAVANDIHAKNPGLSVEEVFKQSADTTRTLLGIKAGALATKRKPIKPAFAKAGGARKKAPEVSSIQKQINDLISGDF